MKAIILNTAALDNGGVRHEAGEHITVGGGKGEIKSERAELLVQRNMAAAVAGAPAKAAATGAGKA